MCELSFSEKIFDEFGKFLSLNPKSVMHLVMTNGHVLNKTRSNKRELRVLTPQNVIDACRDYIDDLNRLRKTRIPILTCLIVDIEGFEGDYFFNIERESVDIYRVIRFYNPATDNISIGARQ